MTQIKTCNSITEILSDYIEGRLSFRDRFRLRFHLIRCPLCTAYFKQFKAIYKKCDQVKTEDLPDDFEKVMSEVIDAWKKKG